MEAQAANVNVPAHSAVIRAARETAREIRAPAPVVQ